MKYAVIVVALLAVFFTLLPQPAPVQALPSESFIIRNVRLFDGYKTINNQDVLVQNGQIKAIGSELKGGVLPSIDGEGKTLLPGLVDAHTHSYGNALQEAINFGVTTELDMFSMPQMMQPMQKLTEQNSYTSGADVFSSSIMATAPEGHGTEYGFKIPVITEPSQVESFVKERIEQGADYIKLVYDAPDSPYQFSPSISKAILHELVKQAHAQGKMAVAHVDNLQSAKDAVNADVDGLVHSFMDAIVDEELLALMHQKAVFITPTLSVEASLAQLQKGRLLLNDANLKDYISAKQSAELKAPFMSLGFNPQHFETAKASVALLHQAGITILAGSDAPNPGTAHGVSLHGELQLLVEAGLSPLQALQTATGNANNAFDIGYRGTIKAQQPATMILVNGDPTQDIKQTRNIRAIWKHGALIKRTIKQQESTISNKAEPGLIADFQQQVISPHWGKRLMATNDTMVGGKSEVALSVEPSGHLKATGAINKGFAYPWAGLQFDIGKAIDVSHLEQITFKAKGDIERLFVMLFQKGSYQPIIQVVTLDKQWQDYTIELKGFTNADLENVTGLSWVASQTVQPFEFYLDDISLK